MPKTATSGRLFENALKKLAKDIVWKDMYASNLGDAQLSTDDLREIDIYLSGARHLLMYYPKEELERVEDMSPSEYISYLNRELRTDELAARKKYFDMFFYAVDSSLTDTDRITKSKYIEKNPYHRMLNGAPALGCEFKYLLLYPSRYDTDHDKWVYTPLCDCSEKKKNEALDCGFIADALEYAKNDKGFAYVEYMMEKRIHPFVSRLADRFDLLYVPGTAIPYLATDFRDVYAECQNFIRMRYYSTAFRNQYKYYEGLMGMSILFMTINRMQSKYLEADITRDFYDRDSVKIVYEAYSVPFFEEIPDDYHVKIIKAINRLLSYKGSYRSFLELFDIFDQMNLQIYQYYLLRIQLKDDFGRPKIVYRKNEYGEDTDQLDTREMYELQFVQAGIGENPYIYLMDDNNYHNYDGVVSADPYWVNNKELLDKIYDEESFNFIETKYLGIGMTYSLTRYLFESCYFMQMLIDNRDFIANFRVEHGKLGSIRLFDMIIYINAIVCQIIGVTGEIRSILQDPTKMSAIYGYNFTKDLSTIYSYLCRQYIFNKEISTIINDDSSSNAINAHNQEVAQMAFVHAFLTEKSHAARLIECFISSNNFLKPYLSDETCWVCGFPKRAGMYICTNPKCVCNKNDMTAPIGTFIASKFVYKMIGIDDFNEVLYNPTYDYFNNLRRTYDEYIGEDSNAAAYMTREELYSQGFGEVEVDFMIRDEDPKYTELYKEKYESVVNMQILASIAAMKTVIELYINGNDVNDEYRNFGIDLANIAENVGLDLTRAVEELRLIRVLDAYIRRDTDDISDDDIELICVIHSKDFSSDMAESGTDIEKVRIALGSIRDKIYEKFILNRSDIDLADIIEQYFLNNNYIKKEDFRLVDGIGIGDTQAYSATELYLTLSKTLIGIIRNDITIGRNITDANGIIESINKSYNAIAGADGINDILTTLMWRAKDKNAYYALKRIKKMLLTTKLNSAAYMKSDGMIANSYADLLEDINFTLSVRLRNMSGDEATMLQELDYSLAALKKLCPSLIYIQSYGSINLQRIVDYIYSLIKFFKSAKAQLIDFMLQFTIDDKTGNCIKFLDQCQRGDVTTSLPPDDLGTFDYIRDIFRDAMIKSEIKFKDFLLHLSRVWSIKDPLYLLEQIKRFADGMQLVDGMSIYDYIAFILHEYQISSRLKLTDFCMLYESTPVDKDIDSWTTEKLNEWNK